MGIWEKIKRVVELQHCRACDGFGCSHEKDVEDTMNDLHDLLDSLLTPAAPDLAKPRDLGIPCQECGSTDGWVCSWCSLK